MLVIILLFYISFMVYLLFHNFVEKYDKLLKSLGSAMADLSIIDLYFDFTTAVGIANITITDNNNIIVHQESINTNVNEELYIPVDTWDSGNYIIEITYGSITLEGDFTL